MGDYSTAIYALVAVTIFLTVGVIYILRQPTDLPSLKKSDD